MCWFSFDTIFGTRSPLFLHSYVHIINLFTWWEYTLQLLPPPIRRYPVSHILSRDMEGESKRHFDFDETFFILEIFLFTLFYLSGLYPGVYISWLVTVFTFPLNYPSPIRKNCRPRRYWSIGVLFVFFTQICVWNVENVFNWVST